MIVEKKGFLQSIPLRVRLVIGVIALLMVLAKCSGSKAPMETGLWIFIALTVLGTVALILLIVFMSRKSRPRPAPRHEEPEHHPTPAAAPAAAGHGGAHADHGHDHGKLPWSSQVIAVAVVLSCIGLVVFAFVSWANQQAKASVIDHAPPAAVSTSAPTKEPCDALPDPANIREVTVPVEGESEMVSVPSGYLPCYGPYKTYQKLRFKAGNGDTPPSEWGDRKSENKWLGIIPGESSEPLTTKIWFVRMD